MAAIENQRPAGEILPTRDLVQTFRTEQPFLSSVTVILANFRKRPKCLICADISILEGEDTWRSILRVVEDGRAIYDNEPFCIFLPPDGIPSGATLKLCLSSPNALPGHALTAWLHSGEKRIPGHLQCRLGDENFGELGLSAELAYSPPFASSEIPPGILLSPVTQCNLNCTHCISRSTRKKLSRLSIDIRADIHRWCREGKVTGIATDYSGDILWADTHFGGELDYVLNLHVPFSIDTNGVCLTGDVIKKLLGSKLRNLNVSLDASRPERYRRIRRGAPPLEEVLANIRAFSTALTDADLRNEIRLSIGFTLMACNIDELPDLVRTAAKLGVPAIFCRHLEVYTEDMEEESLFFQPERFNLKRKESLEIAEQLKITLLIPPEFDDAHEGNGRMPCLEPWRSAVVLGNGDVAACCVPGTVLGNLNETSMQALWQGEAYQQFRRRVNSSDPPPSCRNCPIHRARNNKLGYFPFRRTHP